MATAYSTDSGTPPDPAGDSGAPLDLAGKISRTEGELKTVKQAIETIITGDDAAVKALVKQLRFKDGDDALKYLREEKARLQDLLGTYEKQKLAAQQQQQQQSGAGASMLLCIESCKCSGIDVHVQACAFSVVWEVQTR
jgi:ribosomal protein L12E/L44/L45/RPP1/RPP2